MIIKNLKTLQKHVSTLGNVSIDVLQTHLLQAERFMRELIGRDIFTTVSNYDPLTNNAKMNELLELVTAPIAHFAVISYMRVAPVVVSNSGVNRIEKEKETTAYKYQVQEAIAGFRDNAHALVSELIYWLDENTSTDLLPQWATSKERLEVKSLFLTSKDLSEFLGIDCAEYFLYAIRGLMREVQELEIMPIMGFQNYNAVVAFLSTGNADLVAETLLKKAKLPIILATMALTIKRRSLEILPIGLYKNIFIDPQAKKESISPIERDIVERKYRDDFTVACKELETYVANLQAIIEQKLIGYEEREKLEIQWQNNKYVSF